MKNLTDNKSNAIPKKSSKGAKPKSDKTNGLSGLSEAELKYIHWAEKAIAKAIHNIH